MDQINTLRIIYYLLKWSMNSDSEMVDENNDEICFQKTNLPWNLGH